MSRALSKSGRDVPWYREISRAGWLALVGATGAWLFEVYDLFILSLSTPALLVDFGVTKEQVGLIATIQALCMIVAGIFGGGFADRFGRVKTLATATAVYAVFAGLAGFSTSVTMFGLLRALGGLGMGATWAAAASLLGETWPPQHRGKGGTFMQLGLVAGVLLSLGVAAVTANDHGALSGGNWRTLYYVGVVPILLALWIWFKVPESVVWQHEHKLPAVKAGVVRALLHRKNSKPLLFGLAIAFCGHYIYWAVTSFLPTYLVEAHNMSLAQSLSFLLLQQAGAVVALALLVTVVDKLGRRPVFIICFGVIAVAVLGLTLIDGRVWLSASSVLAGMGITGMIALLSPWAAELLYQSPVRALAMAIIYNGGRVGGSMAPFLVGALAVTTAGFTFGILTAAIAAVLGIVVMVFAPETRGRHLGSELPAEELDQVESEASLRDH